MSELLPAWEAMTSPEVADLVRRDPVVVLPLAAVEQHGPHLPLSTDLDIGRGLLAQAAAGLPVGFPVRGAAAARNRRQHRARPGGTGGNAGPRIRTDRRHHRPHRRRPCGLGRAASRPEQQPRRQPPRHGDGGTAPAARARAAGRQGDLLLVRAAGGRGSSGGGVAPWAAWRRRRDGHDAAPAPGIASGPPRPPVSPPSARSSRRPARGSCRRDRRRSRGWPATSTARAPPATPGSPRRRWAGGWSSTTATRWPRSSATHGNFRIERLA